MIIPAYNEADRIERTVDVTSRILREITSSFEIIIAEDGSTDGTDKIANQIASNFGYITHLHSDSRQGRGKALNRAFKFASGDVLCYIDVDLATNMNHLKELIDSILIEGYDFSTGSRMMPQSDVKRPLMRDIASRGFNVLVRTFLNSKLYDHQCGFKAFEKNSLLRLMIQLGTNTGSGYEIMVLAQYNGYKVKEFPVVWRHGGATKVNIKKDVLYMGSQIFRLWWWKLHASTKY